MLEEKKGVTWRTTLFLIIVVVRQYGDFKFEFVYIDVKMRLFEYFLRS